MRSACAKDKEPSLESLNLHRGPYGRDGRGMLTYVAVTRDTTCPGP